MSSHHHLNKNKELVVLALGGLGDMLLLTPFIRHFHEAGTDRRILCACPPHAQELFDQNPYIHHLAICSGNELYYWGLPSDDRELFSPFHTIDLERTPEGAMRIVLSEGMNPAHGQGFVSEQLATHFKLELSDYHLEIFTTPADGVAAERLIPASEKTCVLLGFESALPEKNLPVGLVRATRQLLKKEGIFLIEVAGNRLRIGSRSIPLPGIRTMAELAKRCAAIVTVDSFLGHLAAAIDMPAVVLFGPADPTIYGHPANINLSSDACRPCAGTRRRKQCSEAICMSGFSSQTIGEHVLRLSRLHGKA